MNDLAQLLAGSEDWLLDRTLARARATGFTCDSSTLREAWRASIEGLTRALVEAMAHGDVPELTANEDYADHPAAAFGVLEARRHRARGVPLPMFLAMMKHYGRSYEDLVAENRDRLEDPDQATGAIRRFFDRVEIGFCSEWAAQAGPADLSAMQAASRALANEKNLYLTIFESLLDPVLFLDTDLRVRNLNAAAASLLLGTDIPGAVYYGPEDARPDFPWLRDLLASADDEPGPDGALVKDLPTVHGTRRFQVRWKRMQDVSGRFAGSVVLLEDVEDRFAAEAKQEHVASELTRKNRELEQILYVVSHDLRSPLANVEGFAAVLRRDIDQLRAALDGLGVGGSGRAKLEGILVGDVGESLAFIDRSVNRMKTLIGGMLKVSRAGHASLETTDIDMDRLMADLAASVEYRVKTGCIALRIDPLPPCRGDPERVSEVFANLLDNALKYLDPSRPGVVSVQGRVVGDEVHYVVQDNGIGIDPRQQERVFQMFHRVDPRNGGGEGIGLAIVQAIVDRMGGRVWVDSEPGDGCRFHVSFPR